MSIKQNQAVSATAVSGSLEAWAFRLYNGFEESSPMPDARYADLSEVVAGELGQQGQVDIVGLERLGVLPEPQPLADAAHRHP
jgi:hypothetical protein